jgi:type IV pilus biogenesis/stability protein PilW
MSQRFVQAECGADCIAALDSPKLGPVMGSRATRIKSTGTSKKASLSSRTAGRGGRMRRWTGWVWALVVGLALVVAGRFWFDRDPGAPSSNPVEPGPTAIADPSLDASVSNTTSALTEASPMELSEADLEERAFAALDEGTALLEQGRHEEAVRAIQESIRLKPDDEDAYYNLGIALARSGREDEAVAAYRQALELYPEYPEVLNNLGNILLRQKKVDEAIVCFEGAIAAMPEHAAAYSNLGNARREQGNLLEATRQYRRAIQINPDYWEARFNLAQVYFHLNRLDEAISQLERVGQLQPRFAPARDLMRQAVQKQNLRQRDP